MKPGTRLGPYEIVAPLGAGGMGEVYLAKDTRLGREVAIKVLPADVANNPERLARFEREAKTVSALNHPHIVTLHEIGTSEAGPYLVLERIEGQSVRELLQAGPLPLRRVLAIAAQIAEGLAKAHGAGIVHRDLKPENVMVTADGFAKILDFGLARLVPQLDVDAIGDASTHAGMTSAGLILGTVGYLSPEQAAGKPADFRADQFALGAMLYEMAAGAAPFRRDTAPESLTATIREEPEPLRSKRPDLPPQVGWLIERCLAKSPDERYASTKDLARDLGDLRDRLSDLMRTAAAGGAAVAAARSRKWLWILAPVVLAAVAVGSFVVARETAELAPPSYRPLTFRRGLITGARFSPDGRTVYYSMAFGAEPSRMFVTHLERPESEALKLPPGFVLSVSSRDELAVLLTAGRTAYLSTGTLVRVPAIGGSPRPLVEDATYADWAPDGERMAVIRGEEGSLSFPIGQPRPGRWNMVRVSPRNDQLGLLGGSNVEIQDRDGRTLAKGNVLLAYGIAWAPDGSELWFTGSETGSAHDRALYALSPSGKRRLVARAPGAISVYDVSRDKKSALITTGAGWTGISSARAGRDQETPLDLLGRSEIVGLSADGTRLLANETREVGAGAYLRWTDGSQTIPLTADVPIVPIGLSPDGAWALVHPRANRSRLMLVPTGPGVGRDVPLDTTLQVLPVPARWSADGRRLFVELGTVGRIGSSRIYVRDGDQPWRAVTPEGPSGPFVVSPDGLQVATRRSSGVVELFSVDGGPQRPLSDERGTPVHWSADGRSLFLAGSAEFPAHVYQRELATGRITPWRDIAPADPSGVMVVQGVFISSDRQSYVYHYNRVSNDLYLAQGLR